MSSKIGLFLIFIFPLLALCTHQSFKHFGASSRENKVPMPEEYLRRIIPGFRRSDIKRDNTKRRNKYGSSSVKLV